MIDIFLILIMIILFNISYFTMSILLLTKNFMSSLMYFIFLLFFHSYIFLNLKIYYSNYYYILSSWKEITFIIVFFLTLLFFPSNIIKINKTVSIKLLFTTFLLSIYGIMIGILNKSNIFNIMIDNRDIMFPIYYFILFLLMKFRIKSFSIFNSFILVAISIHCLEAIYSYLTFTGNVKDLWFYESATNSSNVLQFESFNFIRNGNLRATGFFSSPLEFSLTLIFFLYISFYYIIFNNKVLHKLFFVFFLLFISTSIYVSQVRTSFLTFFMGLLVIIFIYNNKVKQKYKSFISITVPICYILFTFIYLSFNISDFLKDPSSLGRINQYIEAFELLTSKIGGIGFGNVGPKGEYAYDSNILTSLIAFGWIGGILYNIIYIYIYLKLLSYLKIVKIYSENTSFKVLYFSTISYYSGYIYFCAFQYTLSFALQYLLMIISVLLINELEVISKKYI